MLVLKTKTPQAGHTSVCFVCGEMFERFAFASLEKKSLRMIISWRTAERDERL